MKIYNSHIKFLNAVCAHLEHKICLLVSCRLSAWTQQEDHLKCSTKWHQVNHSYVAGQWRRDHRVKCYRLYWRGMSLCVMHTVIKWRAVKERETARLKLQPYLISRQDTDGLSASCFGQSSLTRSSSSVLCLPTWLGLTAVLKLWTTIFCTAVRH